MNLTCVTPPATPILDVDLFRNHLRIDPANDPEVVNMLPRAVSSYLDGRDGLLSRALITQTWRLTLDGFPSPACLAGSAIVLPLPPLQAVQSVTYIDPDGVQQMLQASEYVAQGIGSDDKARIIPAFGKTWPQTQDFPGAVTVTFRAGYGDGAGSLPSAITQAALLIAAHWFEQREAVIVGNFGARPLPIGAAELLAPYRNFGF